MPHRAPITVRREVIQRVIVALPRLDNRGETWELIGVDEKNPNTTVTFAVTELAPEDGTPITRNLSMIIAVQEA